MSKLKSLNTFSSSSNNPLNIHNQKRSEYNVNPIDDLYSGEFSYEVSNCSETSNYNSGDELFTK